MRLTISGGQHAGGRQAEEDVGTFDDVGQRALAGVARIALLVSDPGGAAGVEHAVAVHREMLFGRMPSCDQHVEAGDAGGTRARGAPA
jgi:hypothetical protein